jgi:hypothetical protein
MGDIVEVLSYDKDIIVFTVKGALTEERNPRQVLNQLTQLISEIIGNSWGERYYFVLDVTDVSLEDSDIDIINETNAWVIGIGSALFVVSPGSSRVPHSVPIFDSVENALMKAEDREVPVQVQIFLEDESTAGEVELALQDVLGHFGTGPLVGPPPIYGSWYRRLAGWMRGTSQSAVGVDLARAMDIQLVGRYQAGIDAATSDAVATLLAALEKTPGAVIQAGSVLLVKYDSVVVVRQLTPLEMVYWHRNPSLFKDPSQALNALQQAASAPDVNEWILNRDEFWGQ